MKSKFPLNILLLFFIVWSLLFVAWFLTKDYETPIRSTSSSSPSGASDTYTSSPPSPAKVKVPTNSDGTKKYEVVLQQRITLKSSIGGSHFDSSEYVLHKTVLEAQKKLADLPNKIWKDYAKTIFLFLTFIMMPAVLLLLIFGKKPLLG